MNKFDGFKLTPSLDNNSNKNEDLNVCRVRSTYKLAKNKNKINTIN